MARPATPVFILLLAAAGAAADQPGAAAAAPGSFDILLRYTTFDPLVHEPGPPAELTADPASNVRIVQFTAPPSQQSRDLVAVAGGVAEHYLGNHALIVRIGGAGAQRLRAEPSVRWVGLFHAAYRLEEPLLAGLAGDGLNEPTRYSILLLDAADKRVVVGRIAALGGRVEWDGDTGPRIEATLTGPQLLALAHEDGVLFIDRWAPPTTCMDLVREAGGANFLENTAGYTGEGVRGEVQDIGGLLLTHTDWQAIPPILHGPNGGFTNHATSVYGIVFGGGISNPAGRGLLPDAQGITAAWIFEGRRNHLTELIAAPYFAVFQTNSWGQGLTTTYTTLAAEIDQILMDIDLLFLQAQGNEGHTSSVNPAFAKNLVSVGGIRHQNTLSLADDTHNGQAGSTGPASDGRIKPDLCFWYDNIFTTTNSAPNAYTSNFGGTSAATPMVAGHFGLMFQMWSEGIFGNSVNPGGTVFDNRPKMATAKAIMVNTAYPYPFVGRDADLRRVRQGWGMPDVQRLYTLRDLFFFVDEEDRLTHGQFIDYDIEVVSGTPEVRFTLVYTDPPGVPNSTRHRVNDLTLEVASPAGVTFFGNSGMLDGNVTRPWGVPNTIDTVENVWLPAPQPGLWRVRVRADEVVQDAIPSTPEMDADFALVVTGGRGIEGLWAIRPVDPAPGQLEPGAPTDIDIIIVPGGDTLVPGSPTLHYRFDENTPHTGVALIPVGGALYRGTIPPALCSDEPNFYFSARGETSGLRTSPVGAPHNTYQAIVGTLEPGGEILNADFAAGLPAGWTLSGIWDVNANCPPSPGACGDAPWLYYGVPLHCTFNTFQTGRNMGVAASPVLNLPALPFFGGAITLRYCSAKVTGDTCPFDCAEIHFNNVRVGQVPDTRAWVEWTIDLSDFEGQSGRLEFRFDTLDASRHAFRGWHVDNVRISFERRVCNGACYADCDTSTGPRVLDIFDFLCFQNRYEQGAPYACDCDTTTGPGLCDIFDFLCFQNAFAAGCP